MSSNECTNNKKTTIFSESFAENKDLMDWVVRLRRDNFLRVKFRKTYRSGELNMKLDHKFHGQHLTGIALQRLKKDPTIFKIKKNKLVMILDYIGHNHFALPNSSFKFEQSDYHRKFFPLGLAYARIPSFERHHFHLTFRSDSNANVVTVLDKFTFIIDPQTFSSDDSDDCGRLPHCEDLWSLIFHNDISYVISIEDSDENEHRFGRICHYFEKESTTFERNIKATLFNERDVEESFKVSKMARNTFQIEHENITKTVECYPVVSGKKPSSKGDVIEGAKYCADFFKEMVKVIDQINKKFKPGEIPRVVIRARDDPNIIDVFITVYYLWQLAKKDPSLVFKKELVDHMRDLNEHTRYFLATDFYFAVLVFLCQYLFLEGKECDKDLRIYDVLLELVEQL